MSGVVALLPVDVPRDCKYRLVFKFGNYLIDLHSFVHDATLVFDTWLAQTMVLTRVVTESRMCPKSV